jgi:hypothetical protein
MRTRNPNVLLMLKRVIHSCKAFHPANSRLNQVVSADFIRIESAALAAAALDKIRKG